MLCFSVVLWLRRLENSGAKNGRARRICGPRCDKICTTPARESDLEVKIVKNWGRESPTTEDDGSNQQHSNIETKYPTRTMQYVIQYIIRKIQFALLAVRVDKICTTPARESDLEVKIVKNWEVRTLFGSWSRQNLHHACAQERFGSQNR